MASIAAEAMTAVRWQAVLRTSQDTQLLQSGSDIRTVQELLGHSDVSAIMMYAHVLKVAAGGTVSPLDSLLPRSP